MADRVGFNIVDVEFNDINGGSFSVTVAKQKGNAQASLKVQTILDQEVDLGLDTLKPFKDFAERANQARKELLQLMKSIHERGQTIYAIGASTKGNVLLQYYGIDDKQIPMIGEVNAEKYECFTPGSWIPIGKEEDVLLKNPDYLLILPWHFRKFFIENPKFKGTKLIFPLPEVQVVEIPSRV
jgi:hypothetical protein